MRRSVIALLGVLVLLVFTMNGCADFAFNPIGRWHFTEQRVYVDNQLTETVPAETHQYVDLVFQKSGTGYIDSGMREHLAFTYEYTDTEVTVTRTNAKDAAPPTVYRVSDDGHTLACVISEYDERNEKGIQQHYRLETVFVR